MTLKLATMSLAFQWIAGLLFGLYAGFRRNGVVDRMLLLSTLVVLAVPGLVLYFAGQYLFGVQLKWLPVSGRRGRVSAGVPAAGTVSRSPGSPGWRG